jgi:hypothetical protein
VVSATDPHGRILGFLDPHLLLVPRLMRRALPALHPYVVIACLEGAGQLDFHCLVTEGVFLPSLTVKLCIRYVGKGNHDMLSQ